MPTLTGTIAEITGKPINPDSLHQVTVRAPSRRASLAEQARLVSSVPVPVEVSAGGVISVDLEPGPAILLVEGEGLRDVYELYVTADMTLLTEAANEAAPAHERSWAESQMVQLRADAVAAADRAESAAGAAASSASAAGVSAGEASDAAVAAAGSASDAAGSASAAASSAAAASSSASAADGSASDAAGAVVDARVARDAADGHATSAAGSASAASQSAAAADGHAGRAETAANEFGLSVTSSTLAPGAAATVAVSGDGPAYSLAFGVPQGEKGDKGDEGEISQAQLDAAVASLVDNAPEALNTLQELAAALGNDPNFATTTATAIGQRALIDGAPAQYDTLGKLVTALQNHELGGSTDASLLTGALTNQVDASDAIVQFSTPGGTFPVGLSVPIGEIARLATAVDNDIPADLSSKSDVGHTHPVSDLSATGTASSTTFLRGDGSWAAPDLSSKSDVNHTHTPASLGAVARSGSAVTLWSGTQAQYDALPTATRNAAGFVAVIT